MYLDAVIDAHAARIGWGDVPEGFPITLDSDLIEGTSGKTFTSFHQLINLLYIYDAHPVIEMDEEAFNTFLENLRRQAALKVLTDVIDNYPDSIPSFDYSASITANLAALDNALGYQVVMSVFELYMSTTRINTEERNAKLSMANLKLEVEGFKNDQGHTVAVGVKFNYDKAIKAAQRKLFPKRITFNSNPAW